MDPYERLLRDFFRLIGELWLARIAIELQKFADALDAWLHDLFAHPTPAWRTSFEGLLAEQAAEGRMPTPESRQELLAFLEGWTETVDWSALEKPSSVGERKLPDDASRVVVLAAPKNPPAQTRPHRMTQREIRERFFDSKLAAAERHLDEMGRTLEALGQKLDAAKVDEALVVEDEVDAIETLIWQHNDALESARAAWLADDLGSKAFDRLMRLSSPAAFGLPLVTDELQAERAKLQWKQIGERLDQRIATYDKIIFAMHAVEAAGTGASLLIGAGMVYTAVRAGGKWAIVKTLAKTAAGGAVAYGVGEAVETGLEAAGVSTETVHGVRLAAELVTWLLLLRRVGASAVKPAPPGGLKPPAGASKPSFPPPVAKKRLTNQRGKNEPHPSHVKAAVSEEQLARAIHEIPDEVVIYWGNTIGAHGPDVISYNLKTKVITLWDVKWRGSSTRIRPSTTFRRDSRPLANSLQTARRTIGHSNLSEADKTAAIESIDKATFHTRTIGSGESKNSTFGDHQ